MMKILRQISVIIIGVVFIFSGVVKAVDPLGSAYKFHDYFVAFGMGWLDWLSLPLGILLCTAEFLAGFSVISGIRQKTGIWLVALLMLFFTPLTLVLALTNPVSDCGCFGDAVKLTNWQTFYKNIVLLVFTVILFTAKKDIKSIFRTSYEWLITGIVAFLFVLFSLGNLKYLPVIDFLPYKTGVRIADKMSIPEGAEPDKYLTTFIYEKNGEQKEFTLENYPADDTTWHFIDQKTVLLKKGYVPPIHDFSVVDMNKSDITGRILDNKGYTLLMISKKLNEADTLALTEGFETGKSVLAKGSAFYILTATASDILQNYQNGLEFCTVDETTLKTMVRANPGYMLLKDGVILGKWSQATLPSVIAFEKMTGSNEGKIYNGNITFTVICVTGVVLLIFSILVIRYSEYRNTDNQIDKTK
jgi:hypothetical protein